MLSPALYFSKFQINYFDYKQNSLKYLLENYTKMGLDKTILEYNDKDYETAIRSDIRQTYFQAIETVFEIFFALLPDSNGKTNDRIIEEITTSELPYSKIREIAQNESYLDFLDKKIVYSNNITTSLGEFLFYYGLFYMEEISKEFEESIKAIKFALHILANEFSDRKEYNSYKHGLRILPALKELIICDADTMQEEYSWSLKNSMTFYSYDKKTKETSFITKTFDSERDLRMTSICSNIIWNMIKFRDVAYNRDKKSKDYQFAIPIFGINEIKDAIKTDVKIQDIKYSLTPDNN
ncbi:MAG: hypothetical protein F9K37_06510 [Bacteroidales bacterium]|nr:MAG: hypothetical protein F9K37_06510 [Bacteroidales bacterium]